jgi:hypothetical protein
MATTKRSARSRQDRRHRGLSITAPSRPSHGSRLTPDYDPFIEIRADQRVNGDGCRLVMALVVCLVVALVVGSNMISSDICRSGGRPGGLWRASPPLAVLIAYGGYGGDAYLEA